MSPGAIIEKTSPVSTEKIENASSSKRLEGKVAVITGGAEGIGKATVELFVEHGAKVVIADVNDKLGLALADTLPDVTFIHCDVMSEENIKKLINTTISRHGRLDILFNNAGILGKESKETSSILNFDPDEFDKVMSVNVRGAALGIKHAASVMIPRGGGCIISTASVAGVMGALGPHAYTASKHALVGLTKNAACELGKHGIRVNCISPSGVATSSLKAAWREEGQDGNSDGTSMIMEEEEVKKAEDILRGLVEYKAPPLKARDIAEAALYLASDESARYVTGHNLVVDGGLTTSKNCIALF